MNKHPNRQNTEARGIIFRFNKQNELEVLVIAYGKNRKQPNNYRLPGIKKAKIPEVLTLLKEDIVLKTGLSENNFILCSSEESFCLYNGATYATYFVGTVTSKAEIPLLNKTRFTQKTHFPSYCTWLEFKEAQQIISKLDQPALAQFMKQLGQQGLSVH